MTQTVPIRFHQIIFIVAVLGLCWQGMMAVHELGHVIGAFATGGRVNRVVLHPAAISRTDVSPNPSPTIVVWAGPVAGSLLPLVMLAAFHVAKLSGQGRGLLQFFAGFCLLANGAYIGVGGFDGVGDAGEMLRNGTPMWAMLVFGISACALGLWLWHRLGPLKHFLTHPETVRWPHAFFTAALLAAVIAAELLLSARS